MMLADSGVTPDISSLVGLTYIFMAGLITVGIETLRRYIKHRMDIWEAAHPIPGRHKKKKDDDDEDDEDE